MHVCIFRTCQIARILATTNPSLRTSNPTCTQSHAEKSHKRNCYAGYRAKTTTLFSIAATSKCRPLRGHTWACAAGRSICTWSQIANRQLMLVQTSAAPLHPQPVSIAFLLVSLYHTRGYAHGYPIDTVKESLWATRHMHSRARTCLQPYPAATCRHNELIPCCALRQMCRLLARAGAAVIYPDIIFQAQQQAQGLAGHSRSETEVS